MSNESERRRHSNESVGNVRKMQEMLAHDLSHMKEFKVSLPGKY